MRIKKRYINDMRIKKSLTEKILKDISTKLLLFLIHVVTIKVPLFYKIHNKISISVHRYSKKVKNIHLNQKINIRGPNVLTSLKVLLKGSDD